MFAFWVGAYGRFGCIRNTEDCNQDATSLNYFRSIRCGYTQLGYMTSVDRVMKGSRIVEGVVGAGVPQNIGHFRVPSSVCFKARLITKPLICNCFYFIVYSHAIKLIITRKVLREASFKSKGFRNSEKSY